MNVLLLAPQPFYQERGTPIAVDMTLKGLSERGVKVDVLTYHEGADVAYENVTLHRIPSLPFVRGLRPGFSWQKVLCDFLMLAEAVSLAHRKRYELVHAVEESAFIALALKRIFRIPYVYDMDSSLAQQMIERRPFLGRFRSLFEFMEGLAARNAKAVVPVCEALAEVVKKHRPGKILLLPDATLLRGGSGRRDGDLRSQLGIRGLLLMYVGNLEPYQGVELLLESFALALGWKDSANLVIIGGKPSDIESFKARSNRLEIAHRVHLVGPKPLTNLGEYLSEADILVSPRIRGINTPMKIYSYLDSGKAILATDLPSHTQVLDRRVALLAEPKPEAFAAGMVRLAMDAELRSRLGTAAKRLAQERYSFAAFRRRLNGIYDWLEAGLDPEDRALASAVADPPREHDPC